MALQPLTACVLSPPEWYLASDGFDAVSVQNVGSTYIIVSWDLPTDSNGILINFSLYCNSALAGVLPLTMISYNTTGLLPFTLYMHMSSSHARRHCTPVGMWCWASSVLQRACPGPQGYTIVSRCGMVWFSEDLLNPDMIFEQFLVQLRNTSIDEDEKQHKVVAGDQQQQAKSSSPNMQAFESSPLK
eukprot:Em1017g1a